MIQHGFLSTLVQLDKVVSYWHHMLKEFPNHPASAMVSSSAPISLYGDLVVVFSLLVLEPQIGSLDQFHFSSSLCGHLGDEGNALGVIFPLASKTLEQVAF